MSLPFKSRMVSLLTVLVLFLTTVQAAITDAPFSNPEATKIAGAVIIFLCAAFTALKQFLSVDIHNKALRSMLIVSVIAIVGGANDLLNGIHFSNSLSQWLRFSLTMITVFFNVASKFIYPSETDSTEKNTAAPFDLKPHEPIEK